MLPAVVAGVGALAVAVVGPGQAQQSVGQIKLLAAGLSAGEVEGELLGLQLGVVLLMAGMQRLAVGTAYGAERAVRQHPPFIVQTSLPPDRHRGPRAPARAH